MNTVKDQEANFVKEMKRLEARKSKLFQVKDISKWEIAKPVGPEAAKSMLEDKELAYSYMLMEVS